jgi:hypothetical protein
VKRHRVIQPLAAFGPLSAVLLLALASLRCGSEPAAPDDDDGRFGPPGGVLEVDPGEIPLAGSGGAAGTSGSAGKGGANSGGSSGSFGTGGTSGGSGGAGGSGGGGGGGKASTGGTSGSVGVGGGSSGTGGSAGSGGSAGVTSQPPATFTQVSALDGLELISSNLTQEEYDFDAFQEWFGEVENRTNREACFVEAWISFASEVGETLFELHSFADAAPYQGSISLSVPCIPPGQSAGMYANGLGAIVEIENIRRATVEISFLDGEYAPHPAAPVITSAMVTQGLFDDTWTVSGTARGVATIHNISMPVYPRDPSTGLLVARLTETNLGVLVAGQTWNYETSSWSGAEFFSFLQSLDFIEGAPRELPPPGDERARRIFELAERSRELSFGRNERQSLVRRRALARPH